MPIRSRFNDLILFRKFFLSGSKWLKTLGMVASYHLRRSGTIRFPLFIDLNLTSRCNLACRMCPNLPVQAPANHDLDIGVYKEIVDQGARHGSGFFLTGGEPFLYRGTLELLRYIKSKGLVCGIVTNGTVLSPELTREIAGAGPDVILFSILGQEKFHDAIVGEEGAFDKVYKNLRLYHELAGRRSTIIVNFTAVGPNLVDLEGLVDRLADLRGIHVRIQHFGFVTPPEMEDHARAFEEDFPGEEATLRVLETDLPKVDVGLLGELVWKKYDLPVSWRPVLNNGEIRQWYSGQHRTERPCHYLWGSLYVNHDGSVFPCQNIAYPVGHVSRDSLEAIWTGDALQAFRKAIKRRRLPGCARCCKL